MCVLGGFAQVFSQFTDHAKGYIALSDDDDQAVVYDPKGILDHDIERVSLRVMKVIQNVQIKTLADLRACHSIKKAVATIEERYIQKCRKTFEFWDLLCELFGFKNGQRAAPLALRQLKGHLLEKMDRADLVNQLDNELKEAQSQMEVIVRKVIGSTLDQFFVNAKGRRELAKSSQTNEEKIDSLVEILDDLLTNCFHVFYNQQKQEFNEILEKNDFKDRVSDFQRRYADAQSSWVQAKMRVCRVAPPSQISSILAKEIEKMATQKQVLQECIKRKEKARAFQKTSAGFSLYNGKGVCLGATLELTAKRIHKPLIESCIEPTQTARFLNAASGARMTVGEQYILQEQGRDFWHRLRLYLAMNQDSFMGFLCYKAFQAVQYFLFNRGEKEFFLRFSDDVEVMLVRHRHIDATFLKKLGITWDTFDNGVRGVDDFLNILETLQDKGPHFALILSERMKGKAEEEEEKADRGNTQLATEFQKQMDALSEDDNETKILQFKSEKKASFVEQIVTARLGENAPQAIRRRVKMRVEVELEKVIKDYLPQMRYVGDEEKSTSGHAIYMHLQSPYEIQDVNYPGFSHLKTDDFEEFKLFLLFWFTLNPYSKVREYQITNLASTA